MNEEMDKHTPGPWVYLEAEGEDDSFPVHSEGEQLPYLYRVGVVSLDGRSRGEAEANARLIATAPDLLAACKAALAWNDELGRVATEGGPESDHDMLDFANNAWATAARAAIARAEGTSEGTTP